jgi:hypothetical protein
VIGEQLMIEEEAMARNQLVGGRLRDRRPGSIKSEQRVRPGRREQL